MQEITVNGEEWGMIMIGRNGDIPTYRKKIDGTWKAVKKDLVPKGVVDAFFVEIKEVKEIKDVKEDLGFTGEAPQVNWEEMYQEAVQTSAENLSLKELCELLYTRFGIYTSYLLREPKGTDIHPITGDVMTNFIRGQARQQYLQAVSKRTNYDPKVMERILRGRESSFDLAEHKAGSAHFEKPTIEKPTEDNPYADKTLTMKEWRQQRDAERPTMISERGNYQEGTDDDELYAEPPINGRTIIRPYATNPIAEKRLANKRERRGY